MRSLSGLSTLAKRTTFAVGAIGAFAAKTGIEFNSMLETQTTAFEGLFGSATKARRFVDELFTIAAKTPFESEDVIRGVQLLTAYGLSANDAKKTFLELGNAVAVSGRGSEAIQRSTLALGQIASAGVVHQEDLNQLLEAGTISTDKLSKAYGMSGQQFRDAIAGSEITAKSFFKKTREMWKNDPLYKGAAAKQAKTFTGQLSTLRDFTKRTLGTVTEPLFNSLERDGLPRLTRFAEKVNAIFKRNLSISDKLDLTGEALRRELGPLVTQFQAFWEQSKMGDRIAGGIATALVEGVGKSASTAAQAFVNAWIKAPAWLHIAGGGWFLKKLGLFDRKGKGGGVLGGALRGAVPTKPMYVHVVNSVGKGGGGGTTVVGDPSKGGKGGRFGKAGKTVGKVLRFGGRAIEAVAVADIASSILSGKSIFDPKNPLYQAMNSLSAERNPNLSPTGPLRGRGPEQFGPSSSPQPPVDFGMGRVPMLQAPPPDWITSPISISIDGQEIAKVVARAAVRRQSTK
jgi:tape measure domain-containing protein